MTQKQPNGPTGAPWLDEGRPEAEKLIRYSMAAPSRLLSHRTSGYMGNVGLEVPHGDPAHSDCQCSWMFCLGIVGLNLARKCAGVKRPPRHLVKDAIRVASPRPAQPKEQ